MKLKLSAFVFVFVAAMFPLTASADLGGELKNMFTNGVSSNTTGPSAYKNGSRSGWVGGDANFRIANKPFTLMTFDPPRVSAGCGGIDMHGGSFSFIDSSKFNDLLRTVMQQAVGLLFQAALQQINPGLEKLVGQAQKSIQDLNAMMSNSCAIAHQVVDGTFSFSKIAEQAKNSAADLAAVAGSKDLFAAQHATPAERQADGAAVQKSNPHAGNLLWRALSRSRAAKNFGSQFGDLQVSTDPLVNEKKAKLLIMSVLGTQIINSAGATATEPVNGGVISPTMTIDDIYDGNVRIQWDCSGPVDPADTDVYGNDSCLSLTQTTHNFPGALPYVRHMLYGNPAAVTDVAIHTDTSTAVAPHSGSIYGKIQGCTGNDCTLSAEQLAFISAAGPLFNLLKEAQGESTGVGRISKFVEEPLALAVTINMAKSIESSASKAWSGVRDVDYPQNLQDSLGNLRTTIANYEARLEMSRDKLDQARVIAEQIRKNLPSFAY